MEMFEINNNFMYQFEMKVKRLYEYKATKYNRYLK